MMEKGSFHRYFLDPKKNWHVCQEGEELQRPMADFQAVGITMQYIRGQRYLRGFWGGKKYLE